MQTARLIISLFEWQSDIWQDNILLSDQDIILEELEELEELEAVVRGVTMEVINVWSSSLLPDM